MNIDISYLKGAAVPVVTGPRRCRQAGVSARCAATMSCTVGVSIMKFLTPVAE
jgi:hypothetical protein